MKENKSTMLTKFDKFRKEMEKKHGEEVLLKMYHDDKGNFIAKAYRIHLTNDIEFQEVTIKEKIIVKYKKPKENEGI